MEEMQYELSGHRYMGKFRKNIPTEISVNGEQIHVNVRLKRSKVKEYSFAKQDVQNVSFQRKLLWYTYDSILLVVLAFLGICALMVYMPEILVGVAAIALISYGICARSQQMILTLKSGESVCIPVSEAESANEFLAILQ